MYRFPYVKEKIILHKIIQPYVFIYGFIDGFLCNGFYEEIKRSNLKQTHCISFFRRNIYNTDFFISKSFSYLLSDLNTVKLQKLNIQKY